MSIKLRIGPYVLVKSEVMVQLELATVLHSVHNTLLYYQHCSMYVCTMMDRYLIRHQGQNLTILEKRRKGREHRVTTERALYTMRCKALANA
mgnify:CR=1 FL=1